MVKNSGLGIIFFLFLFIATGVKAQVGGPGNPATDGRQGASIINTAVPFLLISPDAKAASMGDVGAATSPDANSIHWNPAKAAFLDNTKSVALSYTPWLQKLVPDINLAYLSGFYRLDDRNVIGGSLRYFSLGDIEFRQDINDAPLMVSPGEFALDGTFARSFGENFSLGTALRFVYSNLTDGQSYGGQQTKAGTALAADVSAYYKKETQLIGKDALFAAGLNISNIGNKIGYLQEGSKLFLPTNLKLGAAATFFFDDYNEFTLTADINKLLVPTPPITEFDPNTGKAVIIAGRDASDLSVATGIFTSFSDAPGGAKEEFKEISYSAGAEYLYNKQFAVRAGYFYENPDKGNRRYLTFGAGFRYNILSLDFAYLLADQQQSPLANTLRFSLICSFK